MKSLSYPRMRFAAVSPLHTILTAATFRSRLYASRNHCLLFHDYAPPSSFNASESCAERPGIHVAVSDLLGRGPFPVFGGGKDLQILLQTEQSIVIVFLNVVILRVLIFLVTGKLSGRRDGMAPFQDSDRSRKTFPRIVVFLDQFRYGDMPMHIIHHAVPLVNCGCFLPGLGFTKFDLRFEIVYHVTEERLCQRYDVAAVGPCNNAY